MSLLGHLGPGLFIMCFYFPVFLMGIKFRWMVQGKHFAYTRLAIVLLFAPLAVLVEIIQAQHITMVNMHHLSMYFVLLLGIPLSYYSDIKESLPREMSIVYEGGLIFCIGYIFNAHNHHGSTLYTDMHKFMFPGFAFASFLFFITYFVSLDQSTLAQRKASSILALFCSIIVFLMGAWFFDIGVAFHWYGNCGTQGCKSDIDDEMQVMEAHAKIPFFVVQLFLITLGIYFSIWIFLKKMGWIQEDAELVGPFAPAESHTRYGRLSQNEHFGSIEMP
jgi:hypothetical protein